MMLRRTLIWALETPRRLAGVLTVGVVVLAAALLVVAEQHHEDHLSSSNFAAPRQDQMSRSKSPPGTEQQGGDDKSRKVAERFLAAYLREPDEKRSKARTDLRRLSTEALWRGLGLTSPDRFPEGPVRSLDTTVDGPYLKQYEVRLASGAQLVLHVVASGHGWRVSDVQAGVE